MNKVLHLIRKNTQLRSSFIRNQIVSHIDYKPYVIFYEKRERKTGGGYSSGISDNIPLYHLAENENFYERLLFGFFKLIRRRKKKRLRELISQIQPKVIHLHYGTDAGIYLKTLNGLDIPKVVSFYGYECSGFPRRFFGYGKKYLQSRVYRYADKVLAMSPEMKNDILSTGCQEEKIHVHYHGSDVKRFKRDHEYKQNKPVKFLIISGLVPNKGHMFLLQAFRKAYRKNKNITLTIVGDGPLKSMIYGYVSQNGLNDFVSMPGFVTYGSDEHLKTLDAHDVFIHPCVTDVNGDKEGIPGAIVEAMAAGLPVISTYHGGIPYIIESEKTGLLVNEHDVNALSETILTLANSVELQRNYGKSGQSYAISNLDLFDKEKELEGIYEELINRMRSM